jgi:hypothetical protein
VVWSARQNHEDKLVDTKTAGASTSTVPTSLLDAHASLVPPLGLTGHGGRGVAVGTKLARRAWREAILSLAWVRSVVGEERIADLVWWGRRLRAALAWWERIREPSL